ncbi:hypothetical protein ABZ069_33285 [Streptomyces microflavus]|uniref:hypothetical protein n=1 Tax=Streptomyces microflavus TaxID=1919 RepID=UPI00339F84FA
MISNLTAVGREPRPRLPLLLLVAMISLSAAQSEMLNNSVATGIALYSLIGAGHRNWGN